NACRARNVPRMSRSKSARATPRQRALRQARRLASNRLLLVGLGLAPRTDWAAREKQLQAVRRREVVIRLGVGKAGADEAIPRKCPRHRAGPVGEIRGLVLIAERLEVRIP